MRKRTKHVVNNTSDRANCFPTPHRFIPFIASRLHTYDDEECVYYKAKDIEDWYDEWDFKEYEPNIYSHGFHQYPAKFIPQLARKLLRVFTEEDSVILDIFCGSGTTLIESMLLNRKEAIGIELNPFACFMAKVKTTPIDPKRIQENLMLIQKLYGNVSFPFQLHNFYNIDLWFNPKQIEDLSKLRTSVMTVKDTQIRNFFLLCSSEVVRRVSLTNHNAFKLHKDKNKLHKDFNPSAMYYFENIVFRNTALMCSFYNKAKNSKTIIRIIEGDSCVKQDIHDESIDFILTSPPYGDSRTTVAYGQFSRLSWQWITDIDNTFDIDKKLLGGAPGENLDKKPSNLINLSTTLNQQYNEIASKDQKRAKEVLAFYEDLFKAISNAFGYLKRNGYFVLVTGNRTVKYVFLRTDLIISELATALGLQTEEILHRNIINKRMPLKNSPTNRRGVLSNTMLKENIIFLKKADKSTLSNQKIVDNLKTKHIIQRRKLLFYETN